MVARSVGIRGWRVAVSIRRAYGVRRASQRQPPSDAVVGGLAATSAGAVAVGLSARLWLVLAAVSAAFAVAHFVAPGTHVSRRRVVAFTAVVLAVVGAWRSETAWDSLGPDALGPYDGWAVLVDDPQPFDGATRVIVELDGERYETWHRGRAAQLRARQWRGGERVRVSGTRRELDADRAARVAWQHVVGEFVVDWSGDVTTGRAVDRASNRVRAAIERAGSVLPGDDGALFRGLVVGDDRDQPRAMIDRFRKSGLSHLTAVSGQNVSFVLAAAGPLLVRMRTGWRWATTLALIAWFVSLTRFEPSIVRAGVMAALSASAFALGRQRSAFRMLCVAVIGLVLVDPLLVWSVGFWLSVGATAGVTTIGPWLATRLAPLGRVALPLGITLGAQAGVVIPALLVFGRLPLVSVPANLLAVPVAGFVMLYGLPAGLVAGWVPAVAPVVMLPCRFGVRWVDSVSLIADRLEPEGPAVVVGWFIVVVAVVAIAAMNWGRHGRASPDR
jgi:competence protein ComEC